jgi:hypothetical protein
MKFIPYTKKRPAATPLTKPTIFALSPLAETDRERNKKTRITQNKWICGQRFGRKNKKRLAEASANLPIAPVKLTPRAAPFALYQRPFFRRDRPQTQK